MPTGSSGGTGTLWAQADPAAEARSAATTASALRGKMIDSCGFLPVDMDNDRIDPQGRPGGGGCGTGSGAAPDHSVTRYQYWVRWKMAR